MFILFYIYFCTRIPVSASEPRCSIISVHFICLYFDRLSYQHVRRTSIIKFNSISIQMRNPFIPRYLSIAFQLTGTLFSGWTRWMFCSGNFSVMALSNGFVSRPELSRNTYTCGNKVASVCKAVIAEHVGIMSGELSDVCVFGAQIFSDSIHPYVDEVDNTSHRSTVFQ